MTVTSALMGSPRYMSPEQMESAKDVDARTDIWALGVILYELVAGTPPFGGANIPELVLRIMSARPQPLRQLRPDAPDGLEAVILRCLEKDRRSRCENVADLAAALLPYGTRRARISVDRISRVLRGVAYSTAAEPSPPSSEHVVLESQTNAQTNGSFSSTRREGRSGGRLAFGIAIGAAALGVLSMIFKGASSRTEPAPSALPAAPSSPAPAEPAPTVEPSTALAKPEPAAPLVLPVAEAPLGVVPAGSATQQCSPGIARCAGHDVQRCTDLGQWGPAVACASKECRGGECVQHQAAHPTLAATTTAVTAPAVATPAPVKAEPAPSNKPNCNPSYYFDSAGAKHFKPECFQ